ncbi:hypothetical protein HPC62_15755 [Thermoleptolyngbya sichuanensis A183]|uniref:Uncharacterized protein n=1 Tax=Thermoleptolyngbya sichuanensis A183 TaxID=2737172 RepID=A0A6M8B7W7_9CYAN|nr:MULTISPECIES: hypothetical protein [Thermoleptolyngbya]QKD83459.1 hypothetical protein HPC62_15755 [Thermoleptolyngbya sichuanensis A183]
MTIANPVVKPISQLKLAPGSMATLRNVTWRLQRRNWELLGSTTFKREEDWLKQTGSSSAES